MAEEVTESPRQTGFLSLMEKFAPQILGKRRAATAAVALLALGVGYHVIFGANGLTVYSQKRQETQTLDREMRQLQQENDRLTNHVTRLQSDPNAIEQQAREQLRYTRPGEVIYALPGR